MAKKKDGDEARSNLLIAALGVVPTPEREAWDHGWAYEDYRRSERAAISGSDGPVTLTPEALSAWELAHVSLSRERSVRSRWDEDEIGGLLASLVVTASERAVELRKQFLESALQRFRSAGPAFITQLVQMCRGAVRPSLLVMCSSVKQTTRFSNWPTPLLRAALSSLQGSGDGGLRSVSSRAFSN